MTPEEARENIEAIIARMINDKLTDRRSLEKMERYKRQYKENLAVLFKHAPAESREARSIELQMKAIDNGWSLYDMRMINDLVRFAENPDYAEQAGIAQEAIRMIREKDAHTLDGRAEILNKIAEYALAVDQNSVAADVMIDHIENATKREPHWTEYPRDERLIQEARENGEFDHREGGVWDPKFYQFASRETKERIRNLRNKLRDLGTDHNTQSEADKDIIRTKGTYEVQQQSAESLNQFTRNRGQRTARVNVSNREAAKRVFGDDVYDAVDRMRSVGDKKERTVNTHNAVGNKYLKSGKNVLEIDISGSGSHLRELDYHGQTGRMLASKDEDWKKSVEAQFGEVKKVTGFEERNHIRCKTNTYTTEDGVTVRKDRYVIPGPTPTALGLLNAGKYSIEESRKMALQIAEDFLKPFFDEWNRQKKKNPSFDPDNVHVRLTGFSRGAVSAGRALKDIKEWIRSVPEYAQYMDKVNFDLLQFDPVPGPDGRLFYGYAKNDLRETDRNAEEMRGQMENQTVIYSLATDHNVGFRPQLMRGCGKYIFGTTVHRATQDIIDRTQMGVESDGKAHRQGFLDLESGEYYRGSGLADLKKGIYFSDEKQNLIRVTNYAQFDRLIGEIHSAGPSWWLGGLRQQRRANVLREVVKEYFIDNKLEMSYESDYEREYMLEKQGRIAQKIMDFPEAEKDIASGFKDVRDILKSMTQLPDGVDKLRARDEVVNACKKYMEKVPVKGTKRDRQRLELCSELMSLMEREQYYEGHGLTPHDKGIGRTPETIERSLKDAEDRIAKVGVMKGATLQGAAELSELGKKLDGTIKDGSNSSAYERMRNAVMNCSKLNGDNTLKEIRDAYKELRKAAKSYIHKRTTGSFKTTSEEGLKRIDIARDILAQAEKTKTQINKFSKGMSECRNSLDDMVKRQGVRVAELQDQRKEMKRQKVSIDDIEDQEYGEEDADEVDYKQLRQKHRKNEKQTKEDDMGNTLDGVKRSNTFPS